MGLITYFVSLLKFINRDFFVYLSCYAVIALAGAPIVFPMLLSVFIIVKSSGRVLNEV